MAKSKDPQKPQEEIIQERKLVEDEAGNIFSNHDSYSPDDAIKRIREYEEYAKQKGLTDIKVAFQEYGYAYDETTYHAVRIVGKRLETNKEYNARVPRELGRLRQQRRDREMQFLGNKRQFQPDMYTEEDAARLAVLHLEEKQDLPPSGSRYW